MPRRLTYCLATSVVLTLLWVLSGCAPQGFKKAMEDAALLTQQGSYKAAYESYKKAVALSPDDEEAVAGLKQLAEIIYSKEMENGIQAFKANKFKTALGFFNTALEYQDFSEARDYVGQCERKLSAIRKDYEKVDQLIAEDQWVEGVKLMADIQNRYADDPELDQRIEKAKDTGYGFYYSRGLNQRKAGRYADSLDSMQSARILRPGDVVEKEVAKAKAYVDAGQLAERAAKIHGGGNLLVAMDLLLQAEALISDHMVVNRMIRTFIPEWSKAIYQRGITRKKKNQLELAYDDFKKLTDLNPEYPGGLSIFLKIRQAYLSELYRHQTAAGKLGDLHGVLFYGGRIKDIDPAFIDAMDQFTHVPLTAFNRYYQMGCFYMQTGEFGKAVLCFRSAETFIGKNALTDGLIKEALDKIKKATGLRIFIWDFSQQIGDPIICDFATEYLKNSLEKRVGKTQMKNITIDFSNLSKSQRISQKLLANDIDWGFIQGKGCNMVITCNIELFKIDKFLKTEWKTRKRMVRKIVDNERFTRRQMRKAELSRKLRIDGYPDKGKLEDEIDKIIKELEVISPKIEREEMEETPYQVATHGLKAYIQIEVDLLDRSGSPFWPKKLYEAEYEVTDDVVPPDLTSNDPKEKAGDPLLLPTDSQFKEQAVAFVLEEKIIPSLMENFENYGMRYYKQATAGGRELRDAVEGYFMFLSCYQDKDREDRLTEKVTQKMDELIADQWLLTR